MSQNAERADGELTRRHRAAALFVAGGVVLTLSLMAVAASGALAGLLAPNPSVGGSLLIVVALLGVGAVVLRRTRFSAMRLRDVAGVRGASGLLASLQKTTVLVALIGYVAALLGLWGSMMTPRPEDSRGFMLRLGVIALAVLLYAYPRRASWRRVVEANAGSGGGV